MSQRGAIIQLQDFSVHDGDGIRTVIFFAGCPLRCRWCANPESWTGEPKLAFFSEKCTGCGLCAQVCPQGFLQGLALPGGQGCAVCGLCVSRCPQGALRVMGRMASVEEVVRQVERDSLFYGPSGGGVTFSGGEATMQPAFLRELTCQLYDRGIGMWLETCGYFVYEEIADILQRLDHVFFDLKHMDSQVHRRLTGCGNERILENCRRVYESGVPMTLRIPAIPEVNMTEENLRQCAGFLRRYTPSAELELLPYHDYGLPKFKALRLGEGFRYTVPKEQSLRLAEDFFRSQGLKTVRYR